MPIDKYDLEKKLIELASQYRQVGDALSKDSYEQFQAQIITKEEYDKIHAIIEEIFKQAMKINRAVADIVI